VEVKAGDGWSCVPPLCRTFDAAGFGARRPKAEGEAGQVSERVSELTSAQLQLAGKLTRAARNLGSKA
jgi:hypothetical protein